MGALVGVSVGDPVGFVVGVLVGLFVGEFVGPAVGLEVGTPVVGGSLTQIGSVRLDSCLTLPKTGATATCIENQ